jgi:hypothetical protein
MRLHVSKRRGGEHLNVHLAQIPGPPFFLRLRLRRFLLAAVLPMDLPAADMGWKASLLSKRLTAVATPAAPAIRVPGCAFVCCTGQPNVLRPHEQPLAAPSVPATVDDPLTRSRPANTGCKHRAGESSERAPGLAAPGACAMSKRLHSNRNYRLISVACEGLGGVVRYVCCASGLRKGAVSAPGVARKRVVTTPGHGGRTARDVWGTRRGSVPGARRALLALAGPGVLHGHCGAAEPLSSPPTPQACTGFTYHAKGFR